MQGIVAVLRFGFHALLYFKQLIQLFKALENTNARACNVDEVVFPLLFVLLPVSGTL